VPLAPHEATLRTIIRDRVAALAAGDGSVDAAAVARAAKSATTAVFLLLIMGADDKSAAAEALTRAMDEFTPNGVLIHFGPADKEAYARLRALVVAHATELAKRQGQPRSLLEYFVRGRDYDETVLGNLITMVEGARYDTHGLWRWILFELAAQAGFLGRVRAEPDAARRMALVRSVVQETLRMQQSEYLHRVALETLKFDGFVIPKGSWVRVCIWEGHRDPAKFDRPDDFIPDRFVDRTFPSTSYAPLGLDHHMCLGATWTLDLGAMLVEELALGFDLAPVHHAAPLKGRFHFEPGPDARLTINKRAEA
jgi:cytochrome P450